MKIMYVTSEASPFVASGGLGDVMGALPAAVKKIDKESEISVILPLYSCIEEKYRKEMKKTLDFSFYLSWRCVYCGIYELKYNNVRYFFVDNEYYFKRKFIYGDFDDGERFAYFSSAVVEFMNHYSYVPDILHANDWQSALTVIYLKTKYAQNDSFKNIKTVFTIHNIEYQGKYDMNILEDVFALDTQYKSTVEFNGAINLLKGALVCADKLTTVSPTYANELSDSYFAFGLERIIDMCRDKLVGIINGIDEKYFSPSDSDALSMPYNSHTHKKGKAENKRALQEYMGLEINEKIPLIAMITRLTGAKGIELVISSLDELLNEDVQFVILGTGEGKYEEIISNICARYEKKARAIIKFDRALSKKLYAASDIFLMPSRSEPCGLAQMVACRYGAVPIVRGVGGLYDTIIAYGRENSNGFVFENFNAQEMLMKIKEAIELYNDEKEWNDLQKRAMKSDFSWKSSAEKYVGIYRNEIY